MVRRTMHSPSGVDLVHPVNHSRYRRRFVLPMYERVVIPHPPRNEGCPVGICGPHRCRVLVCDDRVCDRPRRFLYLLHQRSGVHWCHPWAHRICSLCFPIAAGHRLSCLSYVPLQPMANRWASSWFYFKLSRSGV